MLNNNNNNNNKTCGNCLWFDDQTNLCTAYEDHFSEAYANTAACEDFEAVNAPAESEREDE